MDIEIRVPVMLADKKFILLLHSEQGAEYFRDFVTDSPEDAAEIRVTKEEIAAVAPAYPEGTTPDEIEVSEMESKVSDVLLDTGCCMFHSLAFLWRDRAWLFTAPSGTGKSTQYFLWKRQFGSELRVINGDKPFLSVRGEKPEILPSPWKGKEKIANNIRAELGGIILLRQSRENRIRRLSCAEAAAPVFRQFMFSADSSESIEKVCRIEEKTLESVPVFLLDNKGDNESAKITRDRLITFLEDGI